MPKTSSCGVPGEVGVGGADQGLRCHVWVVDRNLPVNVPYIENRQCASEAASLASTNSRSAGSPTSSRRARGLSPVVLL